MTAMLTELVAACMQPFPDPWIAQFKFRQSALLTRLFARMHMCYTCFVVLSSYLRHC